MTEKSIQQKLEELIPLLAAKGIDLGSVLQEAGKGTLSEDELKGIEFLHGVGAPTLQEYLTRAKLDEAEGRAQGNVTIAMGESANVMSSYAQRIANLMSQDRIYRSDIAASVREQLDPDFADDLESEPVDQIMNVLNRYCSINPNGHEGTYEIQRRLNPSERYAELSKLTETDLGEDYDLLPGFLKKFTPAQLKFADPTAFEADLDRLAGKSEKLRTDNGGKLADYVGMLKVQKKTEIKLNFVKQKPAEPEPAAAPVAEAATQEIPLESRVLTALERQGIKVYGAGFTDKKGNPVQSNWGTHLIEDPETGEKLPMYLGKPIGDKS